MAPIRAGQLAVARADSMADWIDVDDLAPYVNRHHMTSAAQLRAGERFAEAYLFLVDPKRVPGSKRSDTRPRAASGDVEPYPVVANITFAEGPAFDSRGNLYFCNYLRNGTIGRMTSEGAVTVWCETGGAVNGLKVDREGYVIGADIEAKRIIRIAPAGRPIEVLTDRYEGRPYLNPNDLCLDREGNIYFSDPSHEQPGSIYRIGRDRSVRRVATGLRYPNGLAVSPDGRRLMVAETDTNRILVFERRADGNLGEPRTLHQFPDPSVDGVAFDERARLWVARWTAGTVDVLAPDGTLEASLPAGGTKVTNLCFWGKSLYVTVAGRHSIHRLDVGVGGAAP